MLDISYCCGKGMTLSKYINEFYCNECHKYFDIKLNMEYNCNYRIHCPNCGHTHYRKVENGLITDVRFYSNQQSSFITDIRPMLGSCRDFQKETEKDCQFSGSNSGGGFLHRLWKERFSNKI